MSQAEPLSVFELKELLPRLEATIESLQHLAGGRDRRTVGRRIVGRTPVRAQAAEVRERILQFLSTEKKAKVSAITERLGAPC